jgi:hypothetical protein
MSDGGPRLETPLLTRLEQADLLDHLGAGAVSFAQPALPPGQLGDPGLAVGLIALNMTAIVGLCAWLAARGRNVGLELNVKLPGVESGLKLQVSGASTPEQVAKQLEARGVNVPN